MTAIFAFITTHWVWFAFILIYLINILLGNKSQFDSWVLQHPRLGGFLKIIRGALPGDPWLVLSGLSLVIKGTLPAKLMPIVNVISNDDPDKIKENQAQ